MIPLGKALATLLTLLLSPIGVAALGRSLDDCKAIAAKFRNTCVHGDYDTPAESVASMASETQICSGTKRCFVAASRVMGVCAWERRLCVTCRVDDGATRIRVQSNNLPDHCVESTLAEAMDFDYEVLFNRRETPGADGFQRWVATQAELNSEVCPIHKTYSNSDLGIVEYGADAAESRYVMAFALNGVAMQFANQIEEDPVAPITETNEQPLGLCLGHNQRNSDSGMYHYHSLSPCLNPDFLDGENITSCVDNAACNADVVDWTLSGFQGVHWRKAVVGLSKFGHVLYGPYDENGEPWGPEAVDACNGAWANGGTDGEYFYVATRWHPYGPGCQGPTDDPQNNAILHPMVAQCSANGLGGYLSTTSTPTTTTTTAPTTCPTICPTLPTTDGTVDTTEEETECGTYGKLVRPGKPLARFKDAELTACGCAKLCPAVSGATHWLLEPRKSKCLCYKKARKIKRKNAGFKTQVGKL